MFMGKGEKNKLFVDAYSDFLNDIRVKRENS